MAGEGEAPIGRAAAATTKGSARRRRRIAAATGAFLVSLAIVWGLAISPVRLWPIDPSAAPADGSPELTLLSYNVNYGMSGAPATVALMAEAEADVMLLQETTDGWEQAVRARFGVSHPHQYWRSPGPRFAADGMAIVSRYPFEGVPELHPSPNGWLDALHARVRLPGGTAELLDVHLEPPVGIFAVLRAGANHTNEIEAHLRAIAVDPAALVVAGDFNEERGGALEALTDRGMRDAVVQFEGAAPTWAGRAGPFDDMALQLDHVVYGDRWECIAAEILPGGDSDHQPVRAQFARRNRATRASVGGVRR